MTAAAARAVHTPTRVAAVAALLIAAALAAYSLRYATRAVGGSDSACYGLMAAAFAAGEWQPSSALAVSAPWPDASRTVAPAGFVPSPVRAGAASPVCAPGFSLFLAPLYALLGRDGIFLLTPLAAALAAGLSFLFARHLAGPAAGVAAAAIVATTPVLLFQALQPMNDVLVAALWTAVLTAALLPEPARAWALGLGTGLALLVRPNLALPAVVVAGWLAAVTVASSGWSRMLQRTLLAFAIAAAPGVLVALVLNTALYGGPFNSGYGAAEDLFSAANLRPNIANYGRALIETALGFPLLAAIGLVVAPKAQRAVVGLTIGVCLAIWITYLLYRPFPEWWYLRFLLPAIVPMTVVACAAVAWLAGRVARDGVAAVVVIAVAGVLAASQARVASERRVTDLQRLERRFRTAGDAIRERLPSNAVFVTVWESGTVRYHAGRDAVLWDSLAPGALDAAIAWLQGQGHEPFLMLEQWEEPLFRERFRGASPLAALDWPPRFEIERQVRIYSPSDRAVFHGGGRVATEFVMPR